MPASFPSKTHVECLVGGNHGDTKTFKTRACSLIREAGCAQGEMHATNVRAKILHVRNMFF